jgi:hypothetical protein
MRGAVYELIHLPLGCCGILELEVVPFPTFARQHRLAIENTVLCRVSGNDAPGFALALIGHPIATAGAPAKSILPTRIARSAIMPAEFSRRQARQLTGLAAK